MQKKIASPQDLTAELRTLLAYVSESERPERGYITAELSQLAERVSTPRTASAPFPQLISKLEQLDKQYKNVHRALKDEMDGVADAEDEDGKRHRKALGMINDYMDKGEKAVAKALTFAKGM